MKDCCLMDERTVRKKCVPRLRVITLRVDRDVYYRLNDLAESEGMDIYDYVHKNVVSFLQLKDRKDCV